MCIIFENYTQHAPHCVVRGAVSSKVEILCSEREFASSHWLIVSTCTFRVQPMMFAIEDAVSRGELRCQLFGMYKGQSNQAPLVLYLKYVCDGKLARCCCFPYILLVYLGGVLGPVRDKWIFVIIFLPNKMKYNERRHKTLTFNSNAVWNWWRQESGAMCSNMLASEDSMMIGIMMIITSGDGRGRQGCWNRSLTPALNRWRVHRNWTAGPSFMWMCAMWLDCRSIQ